VIGEVRRRTTTKHDADFTDVTPLARMKSRNVSFSKFSIDPRHIRVIRADVAVALSSYFTRSPDGPITRFFLVFCPVL
jgi:hypothetical protein